MQVCGLWLEYPVTTKMNAKDPYPVQYSGMSEFHTRTFPILDGSRDRVILQKNENGEPMPKSCFMLRMQQLGSVPPPLLHVCGESRAIALRDTATCFGITPEPSVRFSRWDDFPSERNLGAGEVVPRSNWTTPGIPFRPAKDTIYLPRMFHVATHLSRLRGSEVDTEHILSLALPMVAFQEDCPMEFVGSSELGRHFKKLRELFVILDDENLRISQLAQKSLTAEGRSTVKRYLLEEMGRHGVFPSLAVFEILTPFEFHALPRWDEYTDFVNWEKRQFPRRGH